MINVVDFTSSFFDSLQNRLTPRRFYPLLLFCLVLIGLTPLLIPGLPRPGYQDLYYHLMRLHAMDVNSSLGEFPSMINHELKNGYGYATGLFYPDLFLYPSLLLMKCGFSIILSYKFLIVIGVYSSVFSAYYCALRLSKDYFCAFAVALLYTLSSYSAVCIFTRAAVGEYSLFVFMPWIILGLYEIILGEPRKFYYLSFGFAGLLCAHRLAPVMTAAICAVFFLFNFVRFLREPKRILYLALSPIPAVLIAAAYILPMLEQLLHFHFRVEADQEECISDLFMPVMKLFIELPNSKTLPWRPSGIGTMLVIVSLLRFRLPASPRDSLGKFRDMLLIAGVGCLLMCTEMPSWEGIFKPLAFIQFPWRFFGPATAFLAFGGGLSLAEHVCHSSERTRYWCWMVVLGALFAWFVNVGYRYGVDICRKDMLKKFQSNDIREIHYLISGLQKEVFLRGDVVTYEHPINVVLSRPKLNVLEMKFDGNTTDNNVELPVTPYFGYVANVKLDNGSEKNLKVGLGPNKLLSVGIPATLSSGVVVVRYSATLLQRVSYCITLVSLTCLLAFVLYKIIPRHRESW